MLNLKLVKNVSILKNVILAFFPFVKMWEIDTYLFYSAEGSTSRV